MSDNKNEGVVRSYSGYVKVSEKMTMGMLTVRGELRSSKFKTSFTKAVGTKLPKDREVILAKKQPLFEKIEFDVFHQFLALRYLLAQVLQ